MLHETKPAQQARYGLPAEVVYCKRCVMSNQRPSSYPEFRHAPDRKTPTLNIDSEGVCDACRYAEKKESIDWAVRERELLQLLDRYRRNDGGYDCLVPGSGGKDSAYAAHVLKYKYGMHPLTVTWSPIMYTDYGWENLQNFLTVGGFDNYLFRPNPKVQRLLTRLGIEKLLHPFQTFILGQKNLAPKVALQQKLPLVFYGENEAEYGNAIAENATSLRERSYYASQNVDDLRLAGVTVAELKEKYGLTYADIMPYLPAPAEELDAQKVEIHYLGYYLKWIPQEVYYYAVDHTGFKPRPFRTQGTYSKYNSIDDKIDDLHYYTTYVKFGLGRASYDAAQEIRNRHLTREEGVALVRQFDGEFPDRYFNEVMEALDMVPERFHELCDEFRSLHLFHKEGDLWKLTHPIE